MVLMGILGKAGAIFTTIPSPVMGGMFIVMFGIITAAGVSNLQVHTQFFARLPQFLYKTSANYCLVLFS